MAGNNGNMSQFLAPPTVTALREEARVPSQHRVAMDRSFSEDMRAEREDLREAAEETLNVILDLGLDGHIKWVSPSWRQVIGTDPESVEAKVISDVLWSNKSCFQDAIKSMKEDDSRSRFIRFSIAMGPDSMLKSSIKESSSTIKDDDGNQQGEPKDSSAEDGENYLSNDVREENGEDILDMEAQGIMIYDRSGDGEGHTMWMLRPSTSPKEVTIDLPPLLVESLGVGAEVLANHLTVLAERAADANADKSVTPTPVLCRICERQITPWWFEKHSELCLQEHTAELEVQIAQENLNEHRHAIVKVLDALEARQGRSIPTDIQQPTPQPEYKGLSIGPSPSSSLASSAPGSSPATPPRSRDPSTSGLGHGRGRSFAVRRPLARIVELILDLCDTALEISTPALKETRTDSIEDLRTLSPQSESRISQVLQWQSPSSNTLEQEQGLAALSADTEQLAKAKVDAVVRHRRIVEYAERIRVEYTVMVEECIEAALSKAERIAAGDLTDSSSSTGSYESDGEQAQNADQANEDEQQPSQSAESSVPLSREHSETATREHSDPCSYSQSPRRGSSVAVSTRSASPLECPTPRSHKSISGVLGTSQPIKRGENSDSSSVPSSSLIAAARATESPSSEKGLSHSSSGRSRKRKSLILPNLSSSPRRQASPGRIQGPGSPLRLSKPRLPSGESMPSPSISPLLTTNELTAQGLPPHHHLHTHHHHHRRQSSTASSDPRAPISPHLSSVSQPQPRPAPPSIKDFEIIKPISKGAFGSVYLSKKKTTGEYFAIKVLKKADMVAKNQVTNVKAERAIMMWQGESDFVAKLYWTFSSKDYLYLVMEYLNGGDCASLVKILGGLPEDWAKKYIAEVVLGVEHLHNRGIVHRDLKPDNLLIDQRGHLKLTDFGLSRMGLVGRQKRVLKSPNESAPDLLKQGPFPRAMSLASSRSASFDFQGGQSPSSTPIMTPDAAGSYSQPSYFSLNQLPPPRESLGRASGYRSDSGGSDILNAMFRTFSLSEGAETPAPLPPPSQAVTEDEAPSEGGESPHLVPLSQTVSATSSSAMHNTPSAQSMLPPPMALFDPEDHNRRFVGTPDYLAPETINGVGQDEMSDWWSLGCILFEFLYGYPPFNAPTPDEVFENILNRRINWPDEAHELVSPEAIDLMNKLMTLDPQQRLGANIEERFPNGGAEIRSHPWFADINWDTLLEDKAEFVPNPENPEDTEYFDARGATLQSFEELEDAQSPQYPMTAGEYPDRPHDALSKVRSQVNSIKRGLMPLHIPPHVRDTRSRRLSEPVLADDFGNFNFKNLPMLERANKDVIQRLRQEAMQAQQRQIPSTTASPSVPSSTPSLEGSPLLPMPLQRTLSQTKGNRPASPSGLSQTGSSPNRPSQPSSPLLVQFSTGQNHERRKTSGSSSAQSQQSVGSLPDKFGEVPRLTASAKLASSAPTSNKPGRLTTHSPEKTASGPPQSGLTRARSQTIGSQDSEGHSVSSKEPFIPTHHKRRSQLFDISPSSSDNEDPRTKALLKVQRRRQSSRRLSQINLLDGPVFRPLDILICEDHPVSRLVMERLFEKLRCRTITAVNGSEAIRYALSEVQFDIIMTEVKLPQINGADVARMIRETRSANRHTPIIAVTGYLKDLPETHHFNALIEKPPTLNKLTEALCRFCQWKPPPKDYVPTHSLMIPPLPRGVNQAEDSPSSISSGFHPVPSSSYRGSSRADSVGSSYFGDMESTKAEEIPVVVSRHIDNWGEAPEGLGISEGAAAPAADPKLNTNIPGPLNLPPLQHAFSAPPTSNPPSLTVPRKQRSSEAIRAKRESLEKRRYEGAESGDDEDEELGHLQARHRAPHTSKGPRSSSKLGTEMMRTNSRGSVVSGSEEILAKERPAESEAGDVQGLGEQLEAFDMSQDEVSSPERKDSKPESPRSSRSLDHMRRPALEPLHEYPTEIHSPGSSEPSAQHLTAEISIPSKDGATDGGDISPGQTGTSSVEPTDSEDIDPDATPRPAPTPAMSEPDEATPRGPAKGRHEENQERPGSQAGHIHLRDVLHWRRR
ncbi:serine threonine protein kinase, putative [Talaromyces stipitatus ATCC 10500]|uniref:non-specific serine/threonine protein kinase n=1 Tax=Talaromyces stipitatus (strain ATCC 10500 / CBS 375.48 / QM 6759 / NRRL 1006) TaxID=441959 RepID=B8MQ89_TALSN|nr:serine threonine protein kinase, putative [Talaromyces stipitatus ATCC 10500]EED13236.1 serine threonine protein kinase, putative [Talaromyces stipitatus ATCC 10500]